MSIYILPTQNDEEPEDVLIQLILLIRGEREEEIYILHPIISSLIRDRRGECILFPHLRFSRTG
jgi:hypothetical protein